MSRLVCGIGFNDNKYPTEVGGKVAKEYCLWHHMLFRCTPKCWDKHPTYTNTNCSENFKSYSFFYEWCQTQVGFNNIGDTGRSWHLDKDILIKGNKVYSENVCAFVPSNINLLLTKRDTSRGEYPVGVRWHEKDKKFHSRCSDGFGKPKHLGCFSTAKEAFLAYKNCKEATVKQVANKYKHQLDARVYNALMSYEVNIND